MEAHGSYVHTQASNASPWHEYPQLLAPIPPIQIRKAGLQLIDNLAVGLRSLRGAFFSPVSDQIFQHISATRGMGLETCLQ